MITVSFTDLFPTAQEAISKYHGKVNGILWSILFLLIGALMAYLIDIFIPEEEKGSIPNSNNNFDIFRVGLVSTIALMIHNFPEGIATFVSGYQDTSLGIAVTLAIALQIFLKALPLLCQFILQLKVNIELLNIHFYLEWQSP